MVKWNNERLTAVLLGVMLAASVFAEGMYREGARYVFWLLLAAVFAFAVFKLKIDVRPKSVAEVFVASAAAVYVLCTFTSVSVWDSLSNVFRYIAVYFFCITAKRTVKGNFNFFAIPLYFISSAAALWGIIDALNVISVNGAFDPKKGLLLSVFHYHNASAMYFACMFILGIYIANVFKNRAMRALVFGCNSVLFSTVLYTQSRGTWFVLVVGLVVYWVMNRRSCDFTKSVYAVIPPILSVVAFMGMFMSAFSARTSDFVCEKPVVCIIAVVLSFAISAALSLFSDCGFLNNLIKPKLFFMFLPIAAVVACAVVFLILPDELLSRITEFSLKSSTVTERALFLKDAFKIFAQHPILGIGGDGWQYVYPSVQTQFYTVAHPHSFFAEMMTDAGVFGILLYAFLIFTAFYGLKKRKDSSADISLHVIALMILLHTLFDFDTDYHSIQILFFTALVMVAPEFNRTEKPNKIFAVLSAVLLIWSAANGVALLNYNHGVKIATASNAEEVYTYTKRAASLMPFKVDYLVTHANVTLGRSRGERKYMYEAEKCLDRAYSLNEYNYETITQLAVYYVRSGNYEAAADEIDKLVDIQPFINETYNRIKAVYYDYMIVPLLNNQTEENLPLLKEMCQRFTDSVNRAYPISEKNHARIEIHTDVRDAQQVAESTIKQLDDMGV